MRLTNNQTKVQGKAIIPTKEEKATTRMLWLLWKLYHIWVVSRETRSHWILNEANSPWETRCKKSWDQFEEYGSLSLRHVKQVSGKIKDHRLDKYKSNFQVRGQISGRDWHPLSHQHKDPSECQFYESESGCQFGDKCSFAHRQVEGQPHKKPKKGDDKSAVAIVKSVRQLSCVSQDIEAPKSSPIFTEEHKSLGTNSTSTFHKSYAASCKHPRE